MDLEKLFEQKLQDIRDEQQELNQSRTIEEELKIAAELAIEEVTADINRIADNRLWSFRQALHP